MRAGGKVESATHFAVAMGIIMKGKSAAKYNDLRAKLKDVFLKTTEDVLNKIAGEWDTQRFDEYFEEPLPENQHDRVEIMLTLVCKYLTHDLFTENEGLDPKVLKHYNGEHTFRLDALAETILSDDGEEATKDKGVPQKEVFDLMKAAWFLSDEPNLDCIYYLIC